MSSGRIFCGIMLIVIVLCVVIPYSVKIVKMIIEFKRNKDYTKHRQETEPECISCPHKKICIKTCTYYGVDICYRDMYYRAKNDLANSSEDIDD